MKTGKDGEDNNLLFAIGLPRSGTSLLYALLNQHEKISLMYECEMFVLPCVDLAARFRLNWLSRMEFWNQALSRHGFAVSSELAQRIENPVCLYRVYGSRKKGAVFHGEKSPVYSARLPLLVRRFPQARFIVIHRSFSKIYRSVLDAARHASYFATQGTLWRLIYKQEKFIRDSLRLEAMGAIIHHVSYTDLVERTEESCRKMCEFLRLDFDPKMTVLEGADLSAVPPGEHHGQLRDRQIAARRKQEITLAPKVEALIDSFQKRWNRLLGSRAGKSSGMETIKEPNWLQVLSYRTIGGLIHRRQLVARTIFEIAPLSWLKFYRLQKFERYDVAHRAPETLNHASPVLTVTLSMVSLVWLACLGWADYVTGPYLTLAPFYIIPAALMTWHVNGRMGLLIGFLAAVVWSVAPLLGHLHHIASFLPLWNIAMRFLLIAFFVMILAEMRVRLTLREGGSG